MLAVTGAIHAARFVSSLQNLNYYDEVWKCNVLHIAGKTASSSTQQFEVVSVVINPNIYCL